MSQPLKILTFNWHEAFICMLAKTGHHFDIVQRFKGGSSDWFYQTRPVPQNGSVISMKSAVLRLEEGLYDRVVCHNFKDLSEVLSYDIPKVLVFHNLLTTELALDNNKNTKQEYLLAVHDLVDPIPKLSFVFISDLKKKDWGLKGDVITPGIDTKEYYGYTGEEPKVLRIGNFMKKRDRMMGYSQGETILSDIPNMLLGLNEQSPHARFTAGWEDLKQQFRRFRVYLNTTVNGYEDGYNLAMLEAMATGMPVVSTYNDTSPIVDGVNGYISDDLTYLNGKIKGLLADSEEAKKMGSCACQTVSDKFPIKDFIKKWNNLFENIGTTKREVKKRDPIDMYSKNILLAYVSYPVTTARYMEESLRRTHNVVTIGPAINSEIIKAWNLENMKDEVVPHDIGCENTVDIHHTVKQMPDYKYPDLFLWIESVYGYFPEGIKDLSIPTACYLIDSHLNLTWHIDWAKQFDYVFLAQQEYIPQFVTAGCENVYWLPLGCDPHYHNKMESKKEYDICFIGSVTAQHEKRKRLLMKLKEKYTVLIDRRFLTEMSLAYSSARIVFNDAINNDLNMRVFEGIATGSMLLTDEAPGSGLTDLFTNKKHLVIYDEDTLFDLADYYLTHDRQREEIAKAGQEEALKNHTYDHRTDDLMKTIFSPQIYQQESHEKTKKYERGNVSLSEKEALLEDIIADIKTGCDNAKVIFDLARIGLELNRCTQVETYIKKFLDLYPANIEISLYLGKIYVKQRKFEKARSLLDRILLFDPANEEARRMKKDIEGKR